MSNLSIRLRNAGLTEANGEIIAQGFLDIEGVNQLKVGPYQREVLKSQGEKMSRRTGIERALESGARLPTIVLGMRGQNFRSSGDDILLYDDTYIIDGLQRTAAMKSIAYADPEQAKKLMIGCEVRFGTSHETEKELFAVLNTKRVPMSPNILLRNAKDQSKAVLTIYGLSMTDSTSPIFERVQWSQRRTRGQLFTSLAILRVMLELHRHVPIHTGRGVVGGTKDTRGSGLQNQISLLERKSAALGLKTFRENTIEFFDALDQTFGVRSVEYGELSPHLRQNFLLVLARLFSDHEDFWDGGQLALTAAHKRRIAAFHIDDPTVLRLAGGSNTTRPLLYSMLKDHMNKGMKKNHLRPRQRAEDDVEQLEAAE